MTQTIINLGTAGALLNGQNGSTASADTNDALFLDWPGDNAGNYVYLSGVTGNFMSVPDEAALDITGDLDLRCQLQADNYMTSTNRSLITKWQASNLAYQFSISSSNVLQLGLTNNGTTAVTANAPANVSTLTAGETYWLRVTWQQSDGRVQFFFGTDGSSWTQLGTDQTIAIASIFSGSAILTVGSLGNTARFLETKIYRAQVLDGIDGTTVLDVDTSVITTGAATSFTAVTGQTVTINRSTSGRKSVAVTHPVWLFGTDDFIRIPNNTLTNLDATQSATVLVIVRQWDTPVSGGRWIDKTPFGATAWSLRTFSTTRQSQWSISDGTNAATSTAPTAIDNGSIRVTAAVLDRTTQTQTLYDNGVSVDSDTIASVGSLTNTAFVNIGRRVTGANIQDFELIGAAIFRRALTATEIVAISDYYQARLS
jgi:hypothetical protein